MELFSIRIQRTFQLVSTPDSQESIFLVLFWGDCQKRTPKQKCRADGISPVHLLPLLQFALVRIAIIVIACHNHMVNQTDIQCFSGFFHRFRQAVIRTAGLACS